METKSKRHLGFLVVAGIIGSLLGAYNYCYIGEIKEISINFAENRCLIDGDTYKIADGGQLCNEKTLELSKNYAVDRALDTYSTVQDIFEMELPDTMTTTFIAGWGGKFKYRSDFLMALIIPNLVLGHASFIFLLCYMFPD